MHLAVILVDESFDRLDPHDLARGDKRCSEIDRPGRGEADPAVRPVRVVVRLAVGQSLSMDRGPEPLVPLAEATATAIRWRSRATRERSCASRS